MKMRFALFTVAATVLLYTGVAVAQFPILDQIANKVVQKYRSATCEQLWEERAQGQGKPKPPQEQELIAILRQNANMRAEFFGKISTPIVSKMFECGMIP